jgi:2-polyprenyl-3-methyl-5-hydroxy-6-metoxy-1,4-benzoquinol methylase
MTTPSFEYASTELDALAGARNYYTSLMHYFAPHLGERVMEVGAGVGTFSEYLRASPGVERLTLVEPARNNAPLLRTRFAADPSVEIVSGYLDDAAVPGSHDTLVAVNVLEHVPDDEGFLRTASSSTIGATTGRSSGIA